MSTANDDDRRTSRVPIARVQFFSVSLAGFGPTGEGQSLETPFGHAGERLHDWLFETRWWHASTGQPGRQGLAGIDDAFVRQHDPGVGRRDHGLAEGRPARLARALGTGRVGGGPDPHALHPPPFFGPSRDDSMHTCAPPIRDGRAARTFHFIDASPAEAPSAIARVKLRVGMDVPDRVGGRRDPTIPRVSLPRDSATTMQVVVVPIVGGPRAERPLGRACEGPSNGGLRDRGHDLGPRE
jgi:hypothetical protein